MAVYFRNIFYQTVKLQFILYSTLFILYCIIICCVERQTSNFNYFVGFQNNKELTCAMREKYKSYNESKGDFKSDSKGCFMLSWGVHSTGDIRDRILGCSENLNVSADANAEGTEPSRRKIHLNSCKRFVMLKAFNGRTGNQLFEVASLIGMAHRYDAIPIVHKELSLLKYFNLPNQITGGRFKMINNFKCVSSKAAVYYSCSKKFDSLGNVTIKGYFQSWRYFENVKDIIRMIFKFRGSREIRVRNYLESISKEGYQRVCIHVRRKDRDNKHMTEVGYNVAEKDFFERARNFYLNKFSKVQFIVVTDHKSWCRKHLKEVDISPFKDPGDDLALMTMSDHVIVSGGTFGWWGAWLSGGTTVYFNGYPRPGSRIDSHTNRSDYYPSNWIGIS